MLDPPATDTIYALSSGAVPAGIAVVRLSGPKVDPVLKAMIGLLPEPRRATLAVLRNADGLMLDRAVVLRFAAPASYTGEDVAELHVHGGRALLASVFNTLANFGLRIAEPGEFSRRAFLAGKLDLTQAEGLADLIAAETEAQRAQAFAQAEGGLAHKAEAWRSTLIRLRAELEARLDFSDESDVPEELGDRFWLELAQLRRELDAALAEASAGERLRDGFRVVLAGPPNAGKSSLMNAIARREVAIVDPAPGTTRDVLEVRLDLDSFPIRLFDTAGLREAESRVEQEGIRRAEAALSDADLILWLQDLTVARAGPPAGGKSLIWQVGTKRDLAPARVRATGLTVSAVTGEGVGELLSRIGLHAKARFRGASSILTRERQRQAVQAASTALAEVPGGSEEIDADLLRSASESIARLSGRIGIEDVLDRVFAEFCIGK